MLKPAWYIGYNTWDFHYTKHKKLRPWFVNRSLDIGNRYLYFLAAKALPHWLIELLDHCAPLHHKIFLLRILNELEGLSLPNGVYENTLSENTASKNSVSGKHCIGTILVYLLNGFACIKYLLKNTVDNISRQGEQYNIWENELHK